MNKVYLVSEGDDYEGAYNEVVFLSPEEANKYAAQYLKNHDKNVPRHFKKSSPKNIGDDVVAEWRYSCTYLRIKDEKK